MKLNASLQRGCLLLSVWAGLGLLINSHAGENSLNWRGAENKVDAQIADWDLPTLLEHLVDATDWEVFVEPGARHVARTKFKNQPPGEALRRLLGNLNYTLLPGANGSTKLLVFQTSADGARQQVVGKAVRSGAKPIPDELVIILKPGQSIDDLAGKLGAKVTGRIGDLDAYRLKFEDADAAKAARDSLKENSAVAEVDGNYSIERPVRAEGLSNVAALPFSIKPTASSDGSQLIIGLIDTPVQPQGNSLDGFLLPGLSVNGEAQVSSKEPTHGTTMWETMLRGLSALPQVEGGTPVRVLPVDVYGNGENTTTFDVAHGISLAVQGGASIINLSLGSEGTSTLLERIIRNSHDQGVLFLGAAGNLPTTAPTYPAAYSSVLAVTAVDRGGNVLPYANRGAFVDLAAPGSSIIPFFGRSYITTGTSVSTAYASGVAAAIAARERRRPLQIVPSLQSTLGFKPAAK
jgi:hypothetical protein